MTEEIDYKGISEGLQADLLNARLEIIKLRRRAFIGISFFHVNKFIKDNYVTCMFVLMALYYIGSFLIEWKKASKYV